MPAPVGSTGSSSNAYAQELDDWQAAFPASVANTRSVLQDGVEVQSDAVAYQCGTDKEVDAAVCTDGMATPGAGIVEIHDLSSPAEVARRAGQTNGWTLETFTRWWNVHHYRSKGLPVPPATPESKRQIANAFLQQQGTDSKRVIDSWNRMDSAARVGNMIGGATLHAISLFPLGGLFIDNPALLAKMLLAEQVAPMLTSSGGPDGGMGSVIAVEAALAAPAIGRSSAAPQALQQTLRLTAGEAAALESRVVGGTAREVHLLDSGPALTAPSAPKLLTEGAARSPGRQLRDAFKDQAGKIDYPHVEGHVELNGAGQQTVKGGHFPTTPRLRFEGPVEAAANRVSRGPVSVDGALKTNNGGISTVAPNYLTHAQSQAELASAVSARQQVGSQWQGTSLDGTTWRLFPPNPNVPQWRGYPLFPEAPTTPVPAGGWLQLEAVGE